LPHWQRLCEERLGAEYPDADIQIRLRDGQCGPTYIELEGEPDDNDMDNIELIIDDAWEDVG
jgi:hypothetical protein